MLHKIKVCIILNILIWGNTSLIAQHIGMIEPFSNEGPAYIDLRFKKIDMSEPLVIVGSSVVGSVVGSVSTHSPKTIYNSRNQTQRTIYNSRNQINVASTIRGGVTIHFQKSIDMFSDVGVLYRGFEANNPDIESSIMMRGPGGGPGGNPGGVVDDPVGSGHVLLFFMLIYGFYVYRKRRKQLSEQTL